MFLPSFDTDARSGRRKNDRFAYGSVTAMRVSFFGWDSVVGIGIVVEIKKISQGRQAPQGAPLLC